jgi:protein transport protein SEC13
MSFQQQKLDLDEATHVIAVDYYSKKLISGTSSGKIVIYYIQPQGPPKLVGSIFAHHGPIWGLEWAHPSFGNIFASCSYDGYIRVWQQQNENPEFIQIHEYNVGCSANTLHFGPLEYGLRFAVALANGNVVVVFRGMIYFFLFFICCIDESGHFIQESFLAHVNGCNALSWFPSIPPSSLFPSSRYDL